jgi:hypothetical protein
MLHFEGQRDEWINGSGRSEIGQDGAHDCLRWSDLKAIQISEERMEFRL